MRSPVAQLGIVHRDLKPANLFLKKLPDGTQRLVVLDFGIAKSVNPDIEHGLKETTVGGLLGSPAFMAPEQLTPGATIDARTDVWALGCCMYALVSGQLPFRGADLIDQAWKVRHATLPSLPQSVSPALAACIARCLERDPQRRFQSAAALADALGELEVPTASPFRWKKPVLMAAAVLMVTSAAYATHRATATAPPAVQHVEPAPQNLDVPSIPMALPVMPVVSPPVVPKPLEPTPIRKAKPAPPPSVDAGAEEDVFERRR